MFRTKVTETLALAGFVPADKPANRQERFGHIAQNQPECRRRSRRSPQRSSLLWLAGALAAMGIAPAQAQTPSETVLHAFGSVPKGAYPYAGLIRDSAGNLYGTTYQGGKANAGVVYGVDAAGQEKVLYSFTGLADGGNPYGGVVPDSAGNLYGTTSAGGTSGYGVVFKLDKAGQETVLYAFTGGADGGYSYAGVIRDSAGNLYGTTSSGGTAGYGVVFEVNTCGQETVLYSFTGGADGGYSYAGVIRGSAGNLYGTTSAGGIGQGYAGYGVVFKLSTAGQETVLYSFTGGADGGNPGAGVIHDSAGNLYGTTTSGGTAGQGVVFKLSTAGQETVLYSFTGGADGGYPSAGGIRDSAGNLYGTASYGGTAGWGVVFKVNTSGQETVLYSFTGGADGGYPYSGLVGDSAGNLYGTTYAGGPGGGLNFFGYCCSSAGYGVVYKVDAAGQETVLYTLPPPHDGASPTAGVVRDSAGNLYGTTGAGGAQNAGVVYKLDRAGQETVLYSFTGGADGGYPHAGVIRDSAGNLYGTTPFGGTGSGVVYKLDTAGQETVLYAFTGGADGGTPWAGVIRDSAGNLYGTATFGGTTGAGVVYEVNAAGLETVLYSFTGGANGGNPYGAGVVRDSAGNLYGTTTFGPGTYGPGVVFKVDPSGQETVLYTFCSLAGCPDGAYPGAGVILDSAGNLYGTTEDGGDTSGCGDGNGCGVVFKLDPSGQETALYSFTGGADGSQQYYGYFSAGLIRDPAGNLYGTTFQGGEGVCFNFGCGVVFKVGPSGQEKVLYTFKGGADGGNPYAGVIGDPAGNLYGTTYGGGKNNAGVVFRLTPQ